MSNFKYHLTLRPPGPGAVPKGYVDSHLYRPPRRDIPGVVRSHGWVEYESPLSSDVVERFDLVMEPSAEQLRSVDSLTAAAEALEKAMLPFVGRLFRVVAETGRFDKLPVAIDRALEDLEDNEKALREDGNDVDQIRATVERTRVLVPRSASREHGASATRTAQVQQLKLYHGTHLENLQSVLETGLAKNRPTPREMFGVYLTPHFETAARYGINMYRDRIPVVLEIQISGNRRIRKMVWDPNDRHETATSDYGEDYEVQQEVYEESAGIVWDVMNAAAKPLRVNLTEEDYYIPGRDKWNLGRVEDIEKLDGFNVAQHAVTKLLARSHEQKLPWTRSEIANKVSQALMSAHPAGEVTLKNGVLKLNKSWYEGREQLILPEEVPPFAIKAVWVRTADFPAAPFAATVEQKTQELPHETADRLQDLVDLAREFLGLRWTQGAPSGDWLQDRLDAVLRLAPEDDEALDEIKSYLEGEPVDFDFWEDAENDWLLGMDDLEDYGTISTDEWGQLSPQQAVQLASRSARIAANDPRDSTRFGSGVLYFCPETNEVLLIKRAEGGSNPGTWADPGGHYRSPETESKSDPQGKSNE